MRLGDIFSSSDVVFESGRFLNRVCLFHQICSNVLFLVIQFSCLNLKVVSISWHQLKLSVTQWSHPGRMPPVIDSVYIFKSRWLTLSFTTVMDVDDPFISLYCLITVLFFVFYFRVKLLWLLLQVAVDQNTSSWYWSPTFFIQSNHTVCNCFVLQTNFNAKLHITIF